MVLPNFQRKKTKLKEEEDDFWHIYICHFVNSNHKQSQNANLFCDANVIIFNNWLNV